MRRSTRVSRAPLAWYLNDFKHFSRKSHRSRPHALLLLPAAIERSLSLSEELTMRMAGMHCSLLAPLQSDPAF